MMHFLEIAGFFVFPCFRFLRRLSVCFVFLVLLELLGVLPERFAFEAVSKRFGVRVRAGSL